jgi:hypothetical protein
MPETTINGLGNSPTRTVTYSDIEIRNYYTYLPDVRVAHNGTKPLGITSMALWVRGMDEPIAITMFVRGAGGNANTPGFYVARGNSANSETGLYGLDYKTNRNSENRVIMGYTPYAPYPRFNPCWFGNTNWFGVPEQRINDDYEYPDNWSNRSLVGRYNYIQVPNAPAVSSAFTSLTRDSFSVRWATPTDNGGSAITGYTVQVSTSSSFPSTGRISYTTTKTSQTVTGLTSGTKYYVRVLASNSLSSIGSSPWSSTVSVTTIVDPPVWQDSQLASTMQENVNYGPDYLYAPSFDNSQKYRVSSTSPNQLPTGIVFNGNYVATVSDVGLIPGKVYAKISGKPAVGTLGNRTIIFEAYNDGGVVTKTINLTILPEASAWTDVTINDLMRKRFAYKAIDGTSTESVNASGTGVEYTVQSGALPGGISIDQNTGQISGTPTSQGTFTFGIRAQNDSGTNAAPDPLPFTRVVRPSATRYEDAVTTTNVSIVRRWEESVVNGVVYRGWVDVGLCKRYDGTNWVFTE